MAGPYLAHFMGRFFQCSSGPPSQIKMLYSNESIYKVTGLLEDIGKCVKMEDFLDAKCTAACWNVGPRPALHSFYIWCKYCILVVTKR